MEVAFNLNRLSNLFGGRYKPVLEIAALADGKGVDQIVLGDHLALHPDGYASYPHGTFPNNPEAFMVEGTTALAAVAAVTQRARLSTNVLIFPLRSALLMAKQLSMIDVIAEGRLDAAVGAGWLKEEFEAAEMPFEGRFGYLEEQIAACRVLWGTSPSTFDGNRVKFRDLYMHPKPPQGAGLPIWLGLSASEKGVDRIARLADGWATPPAPDDVTAAGIRAIHARLDSLGRDLSAFPIRSQLYPIRRPDNSVDVERSFERAEKLRQMGVTMVLLPAEHYCNSMDDVEAMIDRLLELRPL
jgi:probable F420-dependent oxidoreductase